MDQIQNETDPEQNINTVMNSESKRYTSEDKHDVEMLKHESCSQKEIDVINNDTSNTIQVPVLEDEDKPSSDTENNLQPTRSSDNSNMTQAQDEVKITDLCSTVTNILNELNVENFERLLKQIKALSINNEERLQGVVKLVFEKAVDEPNFSVMGASMCKELALWHVPAKNKSNTNKEQQYVSFRTLLVKRCQIGFENNTVNENERNLKLKEIDECTDPKKKKEFQLLLEEYDREMHIKSVGVVRFIVELFQQKMLTGRVMLNFINILFENNRNEDNLECLCTLLKTVGKRELSKNQNLQPYIVKIQQIIDTDHGSISGRVRLMLQNMIELYMGATCEDNQVVDKTSKLMNKPPPMDEITLGSKNLFGNWGRGSNMKTQQTQAITNTANMYAALENIAPDQDKGRSYESRLNKDPYSSKGHSMERSGYNKNYEDGRGSRSGSQHRNAPSTQQQKPVMAAPVSVPAAPPKQQLNPVQLKLRMQNIMEEYLNDCCTLEECESDIKASIDQSKLEEFVIEGYNGVLERSAITRHKAGKLFAYLTKNQTLSNEDLCKALTEVLSQADDLVIDIPKLWDYLAEMIVPLVTESVVTLDKLRSCSDVLVAQCHAHKLIAALLKQLVADIGPNYVVELWQSSGVQFTDFMSADIVDDYVKENKFDFLLGGAGTPVNQEPQSWEQVHSKLLQLPSNVLVNYECVALKSIQSLFTSLKEAEDESGSSTSDEA